MLVIDDLITLPLAFLNINLTPNLFVMIFESLDNFARDKLVEEINDCVKENRMLYELGELDKEKYAQINKQLVENLHIAKKVRSSEYEARIREAS